MKTLNIVYFSLRITYFYTVVLFLSVFLVAPIISAQVNQDNYEREIDTPYNSILKINLPIDSILANSSIISYEISSKPLHGSIDLKEAIAVYSPNKDYIGSDFFSYLIYSDNNSNTLVNVKISINDSGLPVLSHSDDSIHINHNPVLMDTLFQPQVENIAVNYISESKTRFDTKILPLFKNESKAEELKILYFLGTDCPISQKYITELKRIYYKFEGRIQFYGIIPNNYKNKQIRLFKKAYTLPFKLLKDKNNSYAKELGATITPEAYLVKGNGTIYYHGAIDNWFYALGKNRRVVTEHYLENAITAVLSNEKIKIEYTNAIGCYIEY